MRLIDADALYERACSLEAQALDYVGKIIERDGDEPSVEWKVWSAILTERTAFKHDVFDAPSVQPKLIKAKIGHEPTADETEIIKKVLSGEPIVLLPSVEPEIIPLPEIIRCKDCKHKHIENSVWTCPFGLPGGPEFFCGYGAETRGEE